MKKFGLLLLDANVVTNPCCVGVLWLFGPTTVGFWRVPNAGVPHLE